MRGCGLGQKALFREIASFFSRDISRSNKHDTFWHVVSTGYFYVLFLWAIAVSDFLTLEIHKNLGPPLSCITSEAATRGFLKKVFVEISQNSQGKTYARASFLINFIIFFKYEYTLDFYPTNSTIGIPLVSSCILLITFFFFTS